MKSTRTTESATATSPEPDRRLPARRVGSRQVRAEQGLGAPLRFMALTRDLDIVAALPK